MTFHLALDNFFAFKKDFFKNRFVLINLFLALFLNILLWYLLFKGTPQERDLVPLHYSIYFGIDLIGPWYKIFILPILGAVFFLINSILGFLFYHLEKILSYFLVTASVLIQVFLIINGLLLLFINL